MRFAEVATALKGRRVFVTGHSGFKGAWLALWLQQMGAEVTGYALPAEDPQSLFQLARVGSGMVSHWHDLRDLDRLTGAMQQSQPEVVLHLAAEALVPASYQRPLDFFAVNVLGTAHVLEAIRSVPSVAAAVIVTTDKCYKNREWPWGYRESDELGGHDPYSASKACAELVTSCYTASFFSADRTVGVATARAGNVIGGGDVSPDRIVPDLMRAAAAGQVARLRSPQAIRPWQFVLEPLAGYLRLAAGLLVEPARHARPWNFGPSLEDAVPVQRLAELAQKSWEQVRFEADPPSGKVVETRVLRLDSSLARLQLGWTSIYSVERAVEETVALYRCAARAPAGVRSLALTQLQNYWDMLN